MVLHQGLGLHRASLAPPQDHPAVPAPPHVQAVVLAVDDSHGRSGSALVGAPLGDVLICLFHDLLQVCLGPLECVPDGIVNALLRAGLGFV